MKIALNECPHYSLLIVTGAQFVIDKKGMGTEAELTPVSRPCGLYREYIKNEIKKILLSEDILVEVLIDWYGHPTFSKQPWRKYWEPATPLLSPVGLNILENLKIARRQYILTKFSHQAMISYCYHYFCLLARIFHSGIEFCGEI